MFSLAVTCNISIWARFVPGRMNVIAENLSRAGQILPTEWSLHQDIVNLIFQQWGHPNLDLFATRFNTKCVTFVSLTPDHRELCSSHIRLCLSSLANPPTSSLKVQSNQLMLSQPGGSLLAKTDVVRGPLEVNQGKTHSSPPVGENAQITQVRRLSPQPTYVKLPCVEIVQSSLEEKGVFTEASQRIMAPQASSTLKIYASKWKIFRKLVSFQPSRPL